MEILAKECAALKATQTEDHQRQHLAVLEHRDL